MPRAACTNCQPRQSRLVSGLLPVQPSLAYHRFLKSELLTAPSSSSTSSLRTSARALL